MCESVHDIDAEVAWVDRNDPYHQKMWSRKIE